MEGDWIEPDAVRYTNHLMNDSVEAHEPGIFIPLSTIPHSKNANSVSGQFLVDDSNNEEGYPHRPRTKREATASLLQTLYRSLRVSLVKNLIASRWDTNLTEKPKIAIHKSRPHAMLRSVVHLVPVTAALALVALNMAEYYVGGELAGPSGQDDEKLGALQFAAKLHELLMIASLTAVVFTYIRRELVFGEGVPYGALTAGLEIDKFSFLYSSELWSAIWAEWKRAHKKWVLITLLVSCTLLGVSVGPSTANLMRPRLDYWPAGGTDFWVDANLDRLQPLKVEFNSSLAHCNTDLQDFACPHGDWQLIQRQYHAYWPQLKPMGSMPESVALSSPLSTRSMVLRHRSTENAGTRSVWQNAFSSATVSQSVTADAVSETGRLWSFAAANSHSRQKFMFRRDAMYKSSAPQPVVQVRCTEKLVDLVSLSDLKIQFPVLTVPDCVGDASGCFAEPVEFVVCNNSTFIHRIKSLMEPFNQPAITWVDESTCQIPLNSSIVAVATFPKSNSGDSRVYSCTVDSRFANTTISGTRDNPKVITGCPQDFHAVGTNNADWPRTALSAEWADLLFPGLPGQNATAFSVTAATAGMWNNESVSDPYNYPFIIEGILAASIANGIARRTYNNTLTGELKGLSSDDDGAWNGGKWTEEMLPTRGLGWGGSIYNISSAAAASSTRLTMRATVLGYAWSYRGILQKANMTVLLVYSLFALGHFAYSTFTGWTSTAWDTTPEIIALAMNSARTERLLNTGAGIDTVDPLKQKVRVKCVGFHLAYVLDDTSDPSKPIKPNRGYA